MADDHKDELLSSDYDGIQEYDNDLPKWWVYLFYGTVIFSVVYVAYYHFGPGLSNTERLAVQMQQLDEMRAMAKAKDAPKEGMPQEDPEVVLLALVKDASALETGKAVYVGKCASCHGQNGEGIVGPNLTDDYWIHGGAISDVHRIIVEGVLEKGMLSWKGMLSDEEINAVTAYVWSIHGSNPANPKAPQGEKVDRKLVPVEG